MIRTVIQHVPEHATQYVKIHVREIVIPVAPIHAILDAKIRAPTDVAEDALTIARVALYHVAIVVKLRVIIHVEAHVEAPARRDASLNVRDVTLHAIIYARVLVILDVVDALEVVQMDAVVAIVNAVLYAELHVVVLVNQRAKSTALVLVAMIVCLHAATLVVTVVVAHVLTAVRISAITLVVNRAWDL